MAPSIFTVGHSNRTLDELIAVLHLHGIRHVVDVRRQPASRRHPQFTRGVLAPGLSAAGIAYTWLEALGGLREARPGTAHTALDGALAGYAEHMASAGFRVGAQRLLAIAAEAPTAVMCAEADPASCHRRLLSDWLVAHGVEVRHVRTTEEPESHVMSERARVVGDEVVYDRGQTSLF